MRDSLKPEQEPLSSWILIIAPRLSVEAPGLLVDDRVPVGPVGGVPALGLGSSLVSHASKYSRKNDLVSCSYYSSSRLSSLPCVARKWLSLFRGFHPEN